MFRIKDKQITSYMRKLRSQEVVGCPKFEDKAILINFPIPAMQNYQTDTRMRNCT